MKLSLTKDTLLYGFVDLLFRALAFLTFPLFARILSPEEFGLLALVTTLPNLLAALFVWIHQSLQRDYWEVEIDRGALISTALQLNLLSLALLCGGPLLLLFPFKEWVVAKSQMEWSWIVMVALGQIPAQMILLSVSLHRLRFARWHYTLLTVGYQLLLISLTLWFGVARHGGVEGYLVGATLASAFMGPIALWSVRRDLCWRVNWRGAKRMWQFGLPFVFTTLAYWLFSSIDRWMLKELATLAEVGLYSIAAKFSRMVTLFVLAFGQAWTPYAMKARRDDPDYRTLYSQILSRWCSLLFFVAATVALFSREALLLLVTEPYWAAAPIVPLLVAGVALYGTTQVSATGLSIADRTRLFGWASWMAAGLNILLNLWWIPPFGPQGAAFATLCSYGLLAALYLYSSQRYHPIPIRWREVALPFILLILSIEAALTLAHLPWAPWQLLFKGGWLLIFALLIWRSLKEPVRMALNRNL